MTTDLVFDKYALDYDPSKRTVAFDTETWLIQPGRLAPKLVCWTFAEEGQPTQLLAPYEGLRYFKTLLLNPLVNLVGANVAYDMGVVLQHDPSLWAAVFKAYDEARILDVQIWDMLYAIKHDFLDYDPRSKSKPAKFTLETLVSSWLHELVSGKSGENAWRFRYHELDGVPLEDWPEDAKTYPCKDAEYTLRVWQQMHDKEGKLADLPAQCRAAFGLHMLSARGLRTEGQAVRELEQRLLDHVSDKQTFLISKNILQVGGTKKEPKWTLNKKLVQHRVHSAYSERGDAVPMTDPTEKFAEGQVKTDEETLLNSGDPVLQVLAEIGGDQKLLNTYVPLLLKGSVYPVTPRYVPLVASGRCSSYNPNVQNQPRKGGVRECFVPAKGYVFLECDYNIAEVRALAQVLTEMYGDSEMARVIQEGDRKGKGYDVHCFMAAAIMEIDIDEFARRFRAKDKQCKEMRQLAKVVNLGSYGGIGAKNFSNYAAGYGIDIPEDKSRELLELYRNTFPEMRRYFSDIGAQTQGGSSFSLLQYKSGRIRGGVRFCDGANSYVQGLTADGAKFATYLVVYECYTGKCWDDATSASALWGCLPSAFIHDELILEAPFAVAQAAAQRLQVVMEQAMQRYTPDIPTVAEPLLMRRWYKEAEPTFDKEGRLVPWAPVDPDTLSEAPTQADLEKMDLQWQLELRARQNNPDPWCAEAGQ